MTLISLFQEFLSEAKSRSLSPKTILFYRDTSKPFLAFCKLSGLETPEAVTVAHLRAFCLKLQETHKAGGVHAHLRTVRAFFSFMTREEIISVNPFVKFQMPKVPQLNRCCHTVS